MTKRELNWGPFRKNFLGLKYWYKGKFFEFKKISFFDRLRKCKISQEIRNQIENGLQI